MWVYLITTESAVYRKIGDRYVKIMKTLNTAKIYTPKQETGFITLIIVFQEISSINLVSVIVLADS